MSLLRNFRLFLTRVTILAVNLFRNEFVKDTIFKLCRIGSTAANQRYLENIKRLPTHVFLAAFVAVLANMQHTKEHIRERRPLLLKGRTPRLNCSGILSRALWILQDSHLDFLLHRHLHLIQEPD